MSMRILLVGRHMPSHLSSLADRLQEEYFEVARTASVDLDTLREASPDILLLGGYEHFSLCRELRASEVGRHLPVVMLESSQDSEDPEDSDGSRGSGIRLQALEAGVDDVISGVLDASVIMARLRALVRSRSLIETLYAYPTAFALPPPTPQKKAQILLIHDEMIPLGEDYQTTWLTNPQEALERVRCEEFELFVLSLSLKNGDGLRTCAQLAHFARKAPLMVLSEPSQTTQLARALELGADDYLIAPIHEGELRLRLALQLRRARQHKHLRAQIAKSIEMSLMDPLTGLYNRHCLKIRLPGLLEKALVRGQAMALCVIDIDHFKGINDTYGHDAGDTILESVGEVLRSAVRRDDILYRIGGEEFVAALQGASVEEAHRIARRIRDSVSQKTFYINGPERLSLAVTVSIGISFFDPACDTLETLIKRADEALYRAKKGGRNNVI